MNKEIEIPEGYKARIKGNKVILEQKESEDEKIRKELLEYAKGEVRSYNNMVSGDYDSRDKEDKKIHEWWKKIVSYLEKQKEQKPAERSEREERLMKALQTSNARIAELVEENYNLKETKQEWSEEDTLKLNGIINYISFSNSPEGFEEWINFLNALPQRFNLQPKQEWNEKDEAAYANLIWCIEQAKKSAKDENDMGNIWFANNWLKNRLKSLRPQPRRNLAISFMNYLDKHRPDGKMCLSNGECAKIETAFKREDWAMVTRYVNKYQSHWKPSEEQMEALKYALGNGGKYDKEALESLLTDLQKLL